MQKRETRKSPSRCGHTYRGRDQIGDLIVTTSITVPDSPNRTRDMGPVEQHAEFRPSFLAECVKQLGDLERWFGTALLAAALKQYSADAAFGARVRGVDPEREIRDTRSVLRGFGDPEAEAVAGEFEALLRALPVAAPFPGAAARNARSFPGRKAA